MKVPQSGFRIDNPAFPLLQAGVSYWGVTSTNSATLSTLACLDNDGISRYEGHVIKVLSGVNAGLTRRISSVFSFLGTATITVNADFPSLIVASTIFCILTESDRVFAADDTNAVSISAAIGNKASTPTYTEELDADVFRYLKGILNFANGTQGTDGQLPSLYEGWQDETGIDLSVWTVTNPATGTAWARGVSGVATLEELTARTIPNANENARLRSNQRWSMPRTSASTRKLVKRLDLEFEVRLHDTANLDPATFFIGWTTGIGDTRATNNIVGFGIEPVTGFAQYIVDFGGVEQVVTDNQQYFGILEKLKLELYFTDGLISRARFSKNETVEATISGNYYSAPAYLNFYFPTGAGGTAESEIGAIKIASSGIIR